MDLSEGELSYREDHDNNSLFVEKPTKPAGAAVISSLFKHVAMHEQQANAPKGQGGEAAGNMRKQTSILRHALKQHYVRVKHQNFPVAITHSSYLEDALAKLRCAPNKTARVREILPSLLLRKIFAYLFWLFYLFRYQQHEDAGAANLADDIRPRLKLKYRKLFILCRPPKENLFEVLPFLFAIAI